MVQKRKVMESVKFEEQVQATVRSAATKINSLKVGLRNYLKGVMDAKGISEYEIDLKGMQFVPPKERQHEKHD